MSEITWRVLCVDDDEHITRQIQEFIDGEAAGAADEILQVDATTEFGESLTLLETNRYDVIILDMRVGDPAAIRPEVEAGAQLLAEIQRRRFLPIIFYTGLPGLVEDHGGPLVRVVEKTEGVDRLLEEVRAVVEEGLPRLNRILMGHVEEVQRKYMWEFVGPNWNRIRESGRDGTELAYLLGRRLAASLTEASVSNLASELGGGPSATEGRYHPVRMYLMPPVSANYMPGELLRSESPENGEYSVLLTPACDIAQDKAEFMLVARCVPLSTTLQFQRNNSESTRSNASKGELKKLLGNKFERFYYLPAALDVPDLVVDFQQLATFECGELLGFIRVAALDSPFSQALLSQFTRYFSRLGTPDLDIDAIMTRIVE